MYPAHPSYLTWPTNRRWTLQKHAPHDHERDYLRVTCLWIWEARSDTPPSPNEVVIPANEQENDSIQSENHQNSLQDEEVVIKALEVVYCTESARNCQEPPAEDGDYEERKTEELVIEKIISRSINKPGKHQHAAFGEKRYRVRWYSEKQSEGTWEPISHTQGTNIISYYNHKKFKLLDDLDRKCGQLVRF